MGITRKGLTTRLPKLRRRRAGDEPTSKFVVSDEEALTLDTPGTQARWGHERRVWMEKVREHLRPGTRGWRAPHAGRVARVEASVEMRATTVQAAGYWPFSAGSALPTIGAPLGRHLITGATVCADPMSYFLAGLVGNPSCFVIGRPGLGKSTLIRRMLIVLAAWGFLPMVLGDLKPDYVDLFEAMDSTVISIGRGLDRINPLDRGPLWAKIQELPPERRKVVTEEILGRRLALLTGLTTQGAKRSLEPVEENLLARTLRIADTQITDREVVISDLLALLEKGSDELRRIALSGDNHDEYRARTRGVVDALRMFEAGGPFGEVFDGQTTQPIRLDQPLCFDLSSLESDDVGGGGLEAAVQLVCWSTGSAAVSAAKHLAKAGLMPQRAHFLVFDELWRILRSGAHMVEFIDGLTRLNRQRGLGQAMATHTMDDLDVGDAKQTKQARGFVTRSAMTFLGGLAKGERGNLDDVFGMTDKEMSMITDWADETEVDPDTGKAAARPGQGKFLLKVGKKPGTPFRVDLTDIESEPGGVNDTNRAWEEITTRMDEEIASQRWMATRDTVPSAAA